MSFVMTEPANGITLQNFGLPFWKMTMSVVPPPMSIKATPRCFSSSVRQERPEAMGSRISSLAWMFEEVIQVSIFLISCMLPVMIW